MIKRAFSLLLVITIIFTLTACNSNSKGNSVTSNANNTNLAETAFDTDSFISQMPSELRGTTIKFLNWYNPDDRAEEKRVIEEFEAATGITVEVIDVEYGTPYNDKLAGLVATGDAPDVIRMSKPLSVWMKFLQPIVNTGYDFSDPAWNDDVKKYYSVNDIQYAANLSYTSFILFPTLSYHTDTMEEWGFEDPWELYKKGEWTWDKLDEMCAEWVKQGTDYYGVATVEYGAVAESQGLDFIKYDGSQWSLDLYNSDLLEAWKYTIEGVQKRTFVQSTNTTWDLTKHKALFMTYDSTCLEKQSVYAQKTKKYGTWGVVPMPKMEGKETYAYNTELVAWGVPIGAENPKAVPYFISWYANLSKYDLDSLFYNEQAKEVFEALVNEPNRFIACSEGWGMLGNDGASIQWNLFNTGAPSQITTYLQSKEYIYQNNINNINDTLSRMNKEIFE